mmetsp:Transcript_4182/g.5586  ORF Transcript_4182/g.5586 Transcript_4182/m.5586 type:complete len:242 (+) Transcript_4182:202-927(+)
MVEKRRARKDLATKFPFVDDKGTVKSILYSGRNAPQSGSRTSRSVRIQPAAPSSSSVRLDVSSSRVENPKRKVTNDIDVDFICHPNITQPERSRTIQEYVNKKRTQQKKQIALLEQAISKLEQDKIRTRQRAKSEKPVTHAQRLRRTNPPVSWFSSQAAEAAKPKAKDDIPSFVSADKPLKEKVKRVNREEAVFQNPERIQRVIQPVPTSNKSEFREENILDIVDRLSVDPIIQKFLPIGK